MARNKMKRLKPVILVFSAYIDGNFITRTLSAKINL
jgi:hypothetical protein